MMKNLLSVSMSFGVAATVFLAPPTLAADAEAGEAEFRQCQTCHTVVDGQNRAGPSLFGIAGRAIATVDGYRYSPAMTAFGEDGKVWTDELLDQYMTNPKEMVPGTRMTLLGRGPTEEQRANIIAYLKSVVEGE